MSWEEPEPKQAEPEAPKAEPETQAEVEVKKEAVPEVTEPAEEPKGESTKEPEPKADEPEAKGDEPMVPQRLIGKIAKQIRDKGRDSAAALQQANAELVAENQRLRGQGGAVEPETQAKADEPQKMDASTAATKEFLRRQDAYGREKYGKDYEDALLLVASQKDAHLVAKIQGAANPAEALMKAAVSIAEDIEYGSDPQTREKNKQDALKAKWRKEWEAEMSDKFAARENQPTDVQNVRAAGGDVQARPTLETWETSLPGK